MTRSKQLETCSKRRITACRSWDSMCHVRRVHCDFTTGCTKARRGGGRPDFYRTAIGARLSSFSTAGRSLSSFGRLLEKYKRMELTLSSSHHFTFHPFLSISCLIVPQLCRAIDGYPNNGSKCFSSHATVLGSAGSSEGQMQSCKKRQACVPDGYPLPNSGLKLSCPSTSSNFHTSMKTSLVTFATILAAETTGKRASAFGTTVNCNVGKIAFNLASYTSCGPTGSTKTCKGKTCQFSEGGSTLGDKTYMMDRIIPV